jgi:VWFA-related protein
MVNRRWRNRVVATASAFVAAVAVTLSAAQTPRAQAQAPVPAVDLAGHRLWVVVFDTTSMEPDDLKRATTAALKWADATLTNDDVVTVQAITPARVQVLQAFTKDRSAVLEAILSLVAPGGRGISPAGGDAGGALSQSLQERLTFNNDMRWQALAKICEGVKAIPQKKSMLYFTAIVDRPGADNEVELRAVKDACNQANVAINSVNVSIVRAPFTQF